MGRFVLLVILAMIAWKAFEHFQGKPSAQASRQQPELVLKSSSQVAAPYRCDGRTYCSQMTSCAEATYFLKNCPGVKMDGNNDGVPCEQQWCR
ncbi:MAG: excalibur calcium-binding domain-containing protein [Variovorax sp.]|nr:excalibur calcium-binding domain-containing protein [Variovorax sp.]|tara:strand:- start:1626 stop:1904 length:279 start_codon:yes stop_codon:yes gene_type:complete